MEFLKKLLLVVFGASWKTTLIGYAIAALYAWQAASGSPKQQAVAVLIAVGGRLVKDHNVTGGGSSPQLNP